MNEGMWSWDFFPQIPQAGDAEIVDALIADVERERQTLQYNWRVIAGQMKNERDAARFDASFYRLTTMFLCVAGFIGLVLHAVAKGWIE